MRNLEITFEVCDCFLEYTNFRDDIMECKCSCCSKDYQQFFNTCKFSNHDNNKFILLLQKGVYPHEYMDDWAKFKQILWGFWNKILGEH